MSKTLELTTPIEAHGETVSELKFRDLNTEDIQRCGMPFAISAAEVKPDMAVAIKYIVRLAEIPESSVKKMTPKDFMAAVMVVMDFFGDAMGA